MSAWTCRLVNGKAAPKIVPPRLRIPYWKGRGADSEEKHEPVSDIDTAVVDSLTCLTPDGRLEKRTSVASAGMRRRNLSDLSVARWRPLDASNCWELGRQPP